ncbi:DUF2512 family protein [Paenactinomyces guangxiensis]|uniref:DUF2512 family protein n=1 Tax=Paenactinomyces guangxiensis TaxID=1490290 RepID=A0A7W1WSA6_9BACL|nr:DUF2512 family protein [Paenactinomyces guangxiensis]MBA4495043.1 DUF2512 family protein [Paenactinomyces guangxiensis]MBH8592127.1 DUF2512 family protein [Paenactinomyces guangxiensis]
MKHTFTLLIKFLFTSVVLYLILGLLFRVSYTNILLTSIAITVIGYLFDLFLMPRIGNLFSTITDFMVTAFIVWLFGTLLFDTDIATYYYKRNTMPLFEVTTISALVIAAGEWFFHRYMKRTLFAEEMND